MISGSYGNKEPIDMRYRRLRLVKSRKRKKREKYLVIFSEDLMKLFLNDEIANESLRLLDA